MIMWRNITFHREVKAGGEFHGKQKLNRLCKMRAEWYTSSSLFRHERMCGNTCLRITSCSFNGSCCTKTNNNNKTTK